MCYNSKVQPVKAIPFDSLSLHAILTECQPLGGGRVQDIRQPEPLTLLLEIYAGRQEHHLLISADAQFARMHLIPHKLPNAPTPPPFLQSLRKHIEGGTLLSLQQVGFDRIVQIAIRTREGVFTLMVELMGKHSNLILVNPQGLIQSALKGVSPKQSALRPIRSGERYTLPPTRVEGLKNPLTMSESEWRTLWHQMGDHHDWQAHLEGLSRFTATELEQIASAEGLDGILAWAERVRSARWEPVVVRNPETRLALGAYPFPVRQLPPAWQHPRSSLNLAWSLAFGERIQHAQVESLRNSLLPALQRALQARTRALHEIERALSEGLQAERWQLYGELVLAYGHTLESGATMLKAPDYTQPDMLMVDIPLDPTLSHVENAERYFAKARRARSHQTELAERYGILSQEVARLQSQLAEAETCHQVERLCQLTEQARAHGWLKEPQPLPSAKRAEKDPFEGHKIRVHMSPDGYQVLVGENAQANDFLLTRVARPNDWWLHVRTGTGAHVIIRTDNQPQRVPMRTLLFACKLAAQNSTDRHAHIVEVDYTLRKYVRKPRGAPPGFALYTHEKTLRVSPKDP